jgi:hypothetical protein
MMFEALSSEVRLSLIESSTLKVELNDERF